MVFWLQGMWNLNSLTRDWTHNPYIERCSLHTGPPGKSLRTKIFEGPRTFEGFLCKARGCDHLCLWQSQLHSLYHGTDYVGWYSLNGTQQTNQKKKKMTSNTWHTILFPICPWAVAMKSTLRNSSKAYEKMRVVGVSSAHSSWLQKHHGQTSMKSFKHKSSWFCLWIWQVL